jgi:hypothetical protein
MCLSGTSNAYTAVQVVDDGDGGFVTEGAVNTACRCPTPRQSLFHRNQLNSCLFVHIFLECQNPNDFLGMAKRHQALMQDRPRFKDTYSKVLAATTWCSTRTARSAHHGGRLAYLLRGQWPGAQAHGEGRDRAALGRFFTCATGLRPALYLGRPGSEEPAYDFFPPARRACGRRFYWAVRKVTLGVAPLTMLALLAGGWKSSAFGFP